MRNFDEGFRLGQLGNVLDWNSSSQGTNPGHDGVRDFLSSPESRLVLTDLCLFHLRVHNTNRKFSACYTGVSISFLLHRPAGLITQ